MMVRLVSRYMVSQIELVASRMGRVITRTPSFGSTIKSTLRTPAPRATRGAATASSLCLIDEIRHDQPRRIGHALDHAEPLQTIGKRTQLGHERFIHAPLELDVIH